MKRDGVIFANNSIRYLLQSCSSSKGLNVFMFVSYSCTSQSYEPRINYVIANSKAIIAVIKCMFDRTSCCQKKAVASHSEKEGKQTYCAPACHWDSCKGCEDVL